MKGNMSYIVTVELQQLESLTLLRDTIKEIQALSTQGATFNVRLNSDLTKNVAQDVSIAVQQGVQKGAAAAKTTGNATLTGTGTTTTGPGSADLSALVQQLTLLVRALGGPADTETEKPRTTRRPQSEVDAANAANQAQLALAKNIEKLTIALEYLKTRPQGDTPLSDKEAEKMFPALNPATVNTVKKLLDDITIASDTGDTEKLHTAMDKYATIMNPMRLEAAFKTALDENHRKYQTTPLGSQVASPPDSAFRRATAGSKPESGTAAANLPDLAGFKDAVYQGVLAGLRDFYGPNRGSGGTTTAAGGERGGPLDPRNTEVGDVERILSADNLGPSPFVAYAASIKRVERQLRKAQSVLDTASDQTPEGRARRATAQQEVSILGSNLAELRLQQAQAQAFPGYRVGTGAQALSQEYAAAEVLPGSLRAKAFARAGRAIGQLEDPERNLVIAAAQDRVVGTTGLFDQVPLDPGSRRALASIAKEREGAVNAQQQLRNQIAAGASPEITAVYQERIKKLDATIADLDVSASQQANISGNRLVGEGTKAYLEQLRQDRAAGKITPDEFATARSRVELSQQRLEQVTGDANSSPLRKYLTLIPEAVAQYTRKTLEEYVKQIKAGGAESVDPALMKEINANPLLKAITSQEITDVSDFVRGLGDQMAIYRQVTGKPAVPLSPTDELDPDELKAFAARRIKDGAGFAVSTVERRAYAEAESRRIAERLLDPKLKSDNPLYDELLLQQRANKEELLLGGKLFYPDAIGSGDRLIDPKAGRLLSPDEQRRIALGEGVRSADYTEKGTVPGAAEERTMAKLASDADKMRVAMERMEVAAKSLANGSLEPIAQAFERISATLLPLAKTISSLAGTAVGGKAANAAVVAAGRVQAQTGVEDAKTQGRRDRAALAEELAAYAETQKRGRAAAAEIAAAATLRSAGAATDPNIIPLNRDESFTVLGNTRRELQRLQQSQVAGVDLLNERASRGLSITQGVRRLESNVAEYAATQGRFATQLLEYDKIDPLFFGPKARDAAASYLEQRDRTRDVGAAVSDVQNAQEVEAALQARRAVLQGTLDKRDSSLGSRAKLKTVFEDAQRKQLEYRNAVTREYTAAQAATAAREAARAFTKSLPENASPEERAQEVTLRAREAQASAAASRAQDEANKQRRLVAGTLGLDFKKNAGQGVLFDAQGNQQDLVVLQNKLESDAAKAKANLDAERPGIDSQTAKLNAEEIKKIDTQLVGLAERAEKARKALAAAVGKPVTGDADELKKILREEQELLQKRGNLLQQNTEQQFKLAAATGGYFRGLVDKFENLSQYVLAGGVVYTLASQLRNAFTTATGVEADLTRIQGVITGRSVEDREAVRRGIFSAANEFGTPLQSSVQAAKLFAQTGASASETVELTRASLAAQVGAGLESGQATELLIASKNITGGRVGSFDILDRISRIESQYAVSAQDLSQAIQRAGSIAEQLQPNALGSIDALDTTIGAATAIIERTRVTGNAAATSLRFIFSRLASPEVGTKLQRDFGIRLAGKNPDELRPLNDILSSIAERYKELSDPASSQYNTVKAQQLLVSFAGARQVNAAAALLDNFSYAMKVATESSLAFGDTQARVTLQLDTVQSSYARFETALGGFASRTLENGGVGFVAKNVLGGAASFLGAGNTITGGLVSGAGAIGLGVGASAAAAATQRYLAAGVLTARTTALAPALGVGARGLAALGTLGLGAGVLAAALAGIEVLGRLIKWFTQIGRFQEIKEFDVAAFRSTELFQGYQERATGLGSSPADLGRRLDKVVEAASESIKATMGPDAFTKDNRSFAAIAEKALRDQFRSEFPSLRGTNDLDLNAAIIDILRDQYKVEGAPISQVGEELTQKSQELFATALTNLESASRSRKIGEALRGGDPTMPGRAVYGSFLGGFSSILDAGGGRGGFAAGFSNVELRGRAGNVKLSDAENVAPEGRAEALATFFRENVLLSKEEQATAARVRAVQEELKASKKRIDADSIVAEMQRKYVQDFGSASPEVLQGLRDTIRRTENQDRLAENIATGITTFSNLPESARTALSIEELGRTNPADIITQGVKQIFERAQAKITEQLKTETSTPARNLLESLFARLETEKSRPETYANLNRRLGGGFIARERILDPFIQYGEREQAIQGNVYARERFGVGYNAVDARAESGLELIRSIGGIRTNIIGALGRTGARLAFTDDYSNAEYDFTQEGEGGRAAIGALQLQRVANKESREAAEANRLQELQAYKAQLQVTNSGFGNFISGILSDPNASNAQKAGARELQFSLQQLLASSQTLTVEKVDEILRSAKNLEELREAIAEFVEPLVAAANAQKIREAGRLIEATRRENLSAAVSADLAQERELNFADVSVRANPFELLQLGLEDAFVSYKDTLRSIGVTRDLARQAADAGFAESGNRTQYDIALANADATASEAERKAEEERKRKERGLVRGDSTRIAQDRRQEALGLYNSTINGPVSGFLQSSNNFSAQGYEQLFGGIASGFQQRVVESFLTTVQDSSIGVKILSSFEQGSLYTHNAIVSAFREGAAGISAGGTTGVGGFGGVVGVAGAVAAGAVVPGWSVDENGNNVYSNVQAVDSNGTVIPGGSQVAPIKGKITMGAVLKSALPVVGTLVGGTIGPPGTYSQEGASILGGIGSAFGPVGGLIGGLVGGALGSLFKKSQPKPVEALSPLERIERNTREAVQAIENQTQLMSLDSRFLNIPNGFVVPSYTPFGSNGGLGSPALNTPNGPASFYAPVTIYAQPGQSSEEIAQQVVQQISKELGIAGGSLDIRS